MYANYNRLSATVTVGVLDTAPANTSFVFNNSPSASVVKSINSNCNVATGVSFTMYIDTSMLTGDKYIGWTVKHGTETSIYNVFIQITSIELFV